MSNNQPIVPNSTGTMRDFLIRQMIEVADGRQSHATVRSVCALAQQVYNLLNIELRAANMLAKRGDMELKSLDFQE